MGNSIQAFRRLSKKHKALHYVKFSQEDYVKFVTQDDKWKGLCGPITTFWLIGRKKEVKWDKIRYRLLNESDEVERIGRAYYGKGEMQIASYLRHYLKRARLSRTDYFESKLGFLEMMFKKLKKLDNTTDKFGYIAISNQALNDYWNTPTEGTSHAMGIDLSNSAFFDPNGGHSEFSSRKDLVDFFEEYYHETYPGYGGASFIQFYC